MAGRASAGSLRPVPNGYHRTRPMHDADRADPMIRVAVRAAYPSVRAGLRALLAAEPGFLLVDDGDDEADVTVADLEGAATPGDWPRGPAVLLADSPAAFAGAVAADGIPRAYILKESSGAELAAAVRAVGAGFVVFEPAVAALWQRPKPGAATTSGAASLSQRELEVLRLVAAGQPNKSIALKLGISEHTVKFHVGTVLGKLNAASRAEAVALAVRSGLLPL